MLVLVVCSAIDSGILEYIIMKVHVDSRCHECCGKFPHFHQIFFYMDFIM